jgi:hypothetical protein
VKYWLEVSQENQTQRFEERITDYKKIWKLSPMDLKSHRRWYDFSRARDEMFAATDKPESPWYVIDSNDQRRGRLNCITHFLSLIPYEQVPVEKVKLPKRQKPGDYVEPGLSVSLRSGTVLVSALNRFIVKHGNGSIHHGRKIVELVSARYYGRCPKSGG